MLSQSNWRITQYFGKTDFALSNTGKKLYANFTDLLGRYIGHPGWDIVGDREIPAFTEGTVVQVGWNGNWGNSVTIYDGAHWYRLYAHLNDVYVKVGDYIQIGQKIGYMGNTPANINGYKMGVHLHYSKYYKVFWKKIYVDPKDDFTIDINDNIMWERLLKKHNEQITHPSILPRITKLPDGTTRLDLVRKTDSGEIIHKQDVSFNEWVQASIGLWD